MALVSVDAHSVEAASRQLPGRGLAACVQAMGEARTAAATTKQRSIEVFIAAQAIMQQGRSDERALVMLEGRGLVLHKSEWLTVELVLECESKVTASASLAVVLRRALECGCAI